MHVGWMKARARTYNTPTRTNAPKVIAGSDVRALSLVSILQEVFDIDRHMSPRQYPALNTHWNIHSLVGDTTFNKIRRCSIILPRNGSISRHYRPKRSFLHASIAL